MDTSTFFVLNINLALEYQFKQYLKEDPQGLTSGESGSELRKDSQRMLILDVAGCTVALSPIDTIKASQHQTRQNNSTDRQSF